MTRSVLPAVDDDLITQAFLRLARHHVNMLGRYSFRLPDPLTHND
jgi:hypothetical protein